MQPCYTSVMLRIAREQRTLFCQARSRYERVRQSNTDALCSESPPYLGS